MKKILTTALIAILAMTMALSAFAAAGNTTITENQGSNSIDVNAKYVDNTQTSGGTISVDVEWGAMQFTYTAGGTKVWDATLHKYTVNNASGSWDANGSNTVKVTNHSDIDVNAEFTYLPNLGSGIDGTFSYNNNKLVVDGKIALDAGEIDKPENADNVTAALTLSFIDAPNTGLTEFTKVGTITVKITKVI